MLSRLIDRIRSQGNFFANVATMVTGAVAARVLGLLALPFLSRLYTPEEFGVLALFSMVNIVAATLICWGYEPAMVLPEEDREARLMLRLTLWIGSGMAVLMMAVALLIQDSVGVWLNNPAMSTWILVCPFATWCIGLHVSLRYFSNRNKRFVTVSRATVAATGTNVGSQLGFGVAGIGAGGLVLGQTLGRLADMSLLLKSAWGDLRESRRTDPLTWRSAKQLLNRYRDFPLFFSWSNLLYALSNEVPVLLLNVFFSATAGGLYFLANQLLSLPIYVVAQSVAQVFYPRAREAWAAGTAGPLTLAMFKRLLGLGLTPMCLLLGAPEMVSLVLGEKWMETGLFISWLSVWFLTVLVSVPVSQLFEVLEIQRLRLVYQGAALIVSVAALTIGGTLGSPLLAVAIFGVSRAIVTLGSALLLMHKVGVSMRSVGEVMIRELLLAAPFVAAMLALKHFSPANLWVLVGAVCLGGLFLALRGRELMSRG